MAPWMCLPTAGSKESGTPPVLMHRTRRSCVPPC